MTEDQQNKNIEVLKAYWRGEREFDYWYDNKWNYTCTVSALEKHPHRRKPKPVLVKWTMADVPADCWWKRKDDTTSEHRILAITLDGVWFYNYEQEKPILRTWDYLLENTIHSTDRIAWKPCGKLAS